MSRLSAFIRRHRRSRPVPPASFPIAPPPENYPDDALDRLVTVSGREDPDWYEATMRRIQDDAQSDPELAALLRDFNLDRDPAEAFANFVASLRADGRWFALAEYYANVPSELVQALTGHPFVARYGAFEWAYPASAYVDLIEAAGFRLEAVIPFSYRGNALMRGVPENNTVTAFDAIDADLPGTVETFWAEVAGVRAGNAPGYFAYPQAMVFRRVPVR